MTYSEAYQAAKEGKRVQLELPAKLRGQIHRFFMEPLSTGDVMIHIHIEVGFSSAVYLPAMAIDHPNPISICTNLISYEDLGKWEVVE